MVKIKIAKNGWLQINNKERYCPISSNDDHCGDWCALFSEPERYEHDPDGVLDEHVLIGLCKKHWKCNGSDFTDEREVTNETIVETFHLLTYPYSLHSSQDMIDTVTPA